MHPFSNSSGAGVRKRLAALLIVLLLLSQTGAVGEETVVYTVTSTGSSGDGTLEAAIVAANALPAGSGFQIAIEVDGTLPAATALDLFAKTGWLRGRPGATIAGFTCDIRSGGVLTLEGVVIDNRETSLSAIRVSDTHDGNTLLLKDDSSIAGDTGGAESNLWIDEGRLTVDKAPGGTNLNSTLTLTGTRYGVDEQGWLTVKGGTLAAHGSSSGILSSGSFGHPVVAGGRLIMTGGSYALQGGFGGTTIEIYSGNLESYGGIADFSIHEAVFYFGGSFHAHQPPYAVWSAGTIVHLVTATVGTPPVASADVTCSLDGGEAFTAITDAEGKLYLWMPEADEAAVEVDTGESVYRASGTVEANNDNAMLLQRVEPVVTGVIVTPSSVRAERGSTVQFSARVEGAYYPPQEVQWRVENGRAGTTISDAGLLMISGTETSRTLVVTAASAYDEAKSGAAEVAVAAASTAAVVLIAVLLLLLLFLAVLFLGRCI